MKKKLTLVVTCVVLVAAMVIGGTLAYFTDTESAKNTFTVGKVDIDLTETDWNSKEDHTLVPGKVYKKNPTITLKDGSQESYIVLDMYFNKYNPLFWLMAADASADEKTEALVNFTIFEDEDCTVIKQEYLNDKDPQQFSTSKFLAEMTKPANKVVFQAIVNKWFGNITHTDWEVMTTDMGNINTNCFTIRLAYIGGNGKLKANESVEFMDSFGMPSTVTQKMISDGVDVGKQGNTFATDSKHQFNIYFTAYAIQAEGCDSAAEAFTAAFK